MISAVFEIRIRETKQLIISVVVHLASIEFDILQQDVDRLNDLNIGIMAECIILE